jgi:predicted unusual protein kinase regulating ubiquinone biosynthesis (AarF/ABC1/UbiB family)
MQVQRPGLRRLFDIDLANLKAIAEQLDKGDSARDFKGIYEECATILYQEIDYLREGRSCDRWVGRRGRGGMGGGRAWLGGQVGL